MNILVTGGAGFIGSHLVEALVENGDRVTVLDNFSTGKRENLASLLPRIELVEGDIRDEEVLRRVLPGREAVLHQAALPSVPRSFSDPLGTTAVNAGGTIQLLEAARQAEVKRFVFASSSSVYGDSEAEFKVETLPLRPLSPYAVSKLFGEQVCRIYAEVYGMVTVSLRYFNVFGPRQDPASPYSAVIPLFISAVLEKTQPVIFGDGKQTRDFTHVKNVVRANLRALAASPSARGEACNVACGDSVSLLEMLEQLSALSGYSLTPRLDPPRAGDVRHSRADIRKATRLLDYRPEVLFPEGLKDTYSYFLKSDL